MKTLGKGSIASVMKGALAVTWWALWAALAGLVLAALSFAALLALIAADVLDAAILAGRGGAYDIPALLIGAVVIGGGLVIVGRLRKLFDSFTSGEPFRRENAGHLRVIWIAMLTIELSRYALLGLTGALTAAFGPPEGATANFAVQVDLSNWMAILILIVLAEVFREGARLKAEQELTI